MFSTFFHYPSSLFFPPHFFFLHPLPFPNHSLSRFFLKSNRKLLFSILLSPFSQCSRVLEIRNRVRCKLDNPINHRTSPSCKRIILVRLTAKFPLYQRCDTLYPLLIPFSFECLSDGIGEGHVKKREKRRKISKLTNK